MPLFNQTELLKEALDSLQAQTYAEYRLVALDDSTDPEPGRIVRAYAA
jgi:glycosyltransferase involved in cell wall biosynthesis